MDNDTRAAYEVLSVVWSLIVAGFWIAFAGILFEKLRTIRNLLTSIESLLSFIAQNTGPKDPQ